MPSDNVLAADSVSRFARSLGRQTTYQSFPAFGTFTLEANHVSKVTDPSGVVTDIAYNLQNKVSSVTTAAGTWTYTYLDLGNGTTQATVTDPLSHSRSVVVNTDGQVVSATTAYDSMGRLTSQTGPLGAVDYQYDAAGRRTRMTWPDAFYVTYEYDVAGAVTAIKENGATALATFGYDNQGRRTSLTRANGVVTSYGYDPVSRLQTLTQNLGGTDKDQTLTFGYNPASQITSRTSSNAAYAWTGLYNVTRNYGVNGLNQVTSSGAQAITHDPRGNLNSDGVSTYGYDVDNRLTSTGAAAWAGLSTWEAFGSAPTTREASIRKAHRSSP